MTAAAVSGQRPSVGASRLAKVQRGRLRYPLRFVFYGPEGVGKSTLAASAPDPIWFDIEEGSSQLDVARYPFRDGKDGHVPRSYDEVLSAIDDLTGHEHQYKTLVFDTADRLEALIWSHMIKRDTEAHGKSSDIQSIEDYGYGKGYTKAVDEWRALCVKLDRLRVTRGMSIVLLAHSQVRTFKNPTGEDFDRYQPLLNEKAGGFLKGWADVTGFIRFDDTVGKIPGDRSGRKRGFSTNRRLLMLSRTAAFDAKNRINLPDEVEIPETNPWAPLAEAIETGFETAAKVIAEKIAAEVQRIGDGDLAEKVKKATADAVAKGDTAELQRYLTTLAARPAVNRDEK